MDEQNLCNKVGKKQHFDTGLPGEKKTQTQAAVINNQKRTQGTDTCPERMKQSSTSSNPSPGSSIGETSPPSPRKKQNKQKISDFENHQECLQDNHIYNFKEQKPAFKGPPHHLCGLKQHKNTRLKSVRTTDVGDPLTNPAVSVLEAGTSWYTPQGLSHWQEPFM